MGGGLAKPGASAGAGGAALPCPAAAERLIRALFGFAGRALRLLDRWIAAGGIAAMAHHDRLKAHLAAEEPKGGHSTGTRFVFALVLMAAVGIAAWLNLAL